MFFEISNLLVNKSIKKHIANNPKAQIVINLFEDTSLFSLNKFIKNFFIIIVLFIINNHQK
jgi:hypothetical protein